MQNILRFFRLHSRSKPPRTIVSDNYICLIRGQFSNLRAFYLLRINSRKNAFSLVNVLLDLLTNIWLNLQDMRGQCFDNGANMIGKRSGVQARILNHNYRAFFTPCANHKLNLVIGDMAYHVKEMWK